MREVVASHPDELRYLATYIEALLNHDETADAEQYLKQLVDAAPNNFATVNLQAESLFRAKKYDEVDDLLKDFVDRVGAQPEDEATRLRLVAGALEGFATRLKQADEEEAARQFVDVAETLFRRYVREQPTHEILLAAFLARQGRTVEAMEMFEQQWPNMSATNLAQMAAILLKNPATTDEQISQTEEIVEKAMKEKPNSIALRLVMADVRTEQGRYDEAERFYRGVLEEKPDHAVTLNNLAVLLALRGIKLDDAEKMINQAIEIAGPVAAMLDSRATVYMAVGKYREALDDINEAINEGATPVRLFHRAQVHFLAGQKQAAARSLAEAHEKDLIPEMLQPLERPIYQEMRSAIEAP
jgi:Tfp pilus assembly protein PilF